MSSYRPKTKIDDNGTIADLPLDAETLGSYNKTDIRDGVIFYTSTGTAAKTSSPYTASLWNVTIDNRFPGSLYTGLTILMKVPVAGNSSYGVLLTVDGGTTYHPVCRNTNTNISTAYAVGCILILTYDATQTATAYYNSTSAITYTGVWKIADYDANTTITYGTLAYYLRPYTSAALYRYKLCMLNKDNKLVPLILTNNSDSSAKTDMTPTAEAFRPDKIYWYNTTTTVNANAVVGANTLMSNGYNATNMPRCNFNASLTTYKMIYLCGTYNTTTGLFTLRGGGTAGSTQYYVFVPNNTSNITLSSYFTSGYDYILVGASYSTANYMHLREDHPMYHFDGTNLVPYDTYRANKISTDLGTLDDKVDGIDTDLDTLEQSLAPVATSGEYGDLVNTPNLATVATTGSYNDLSNKPTIPTVDYPVTDVKVNNTSVVSSKVANITVPTKTSDLTNDSNFITSSYHDSSKQDTLVSGTNIKTINNTSILGSGNISISGGSAKVDGITGSTINRYASCTTAAGTSAKTASITSGTFSLETGARVTVKFTNRNTAYSATLKIGSTTAKSISYRGSTNFNSHTRGILYGCVDFIYDGTYWVILTPTTDIPAKSSFVWYANDSGYQTLYDLFEYYKNVIFTCKLDNSDPGDHYEYDYYTCMAYAWYYQDDESGDESYNGWLKYFNGSNWVNVPNGTTVYYTAMV